MWKKFLSTIKLLMEPFLTIFSNSVTSPRSFSDVKTFENLGPRAGSRTSLLTKENLIESAKEISGDATTWNK